MTWGRIEREIRLLPQVLACSLADDEVVVLISPASDPAAVEAAVAELLGRENLDLGLRVLGGSPAPAPVSPVARAWRSPAVLIGSVAATGILAIGSLVGGITTREGPSSDAPMPGISGQVPYRPTPLPGSVGEDPAEDEPAPATKQELVRLASAGVGGVLPGVSVPNVGPSIPRDPLTRPPTPVPPPPEATSCHEPAARGAPRSVPGRHQGNGPVPWSHSVLNDPHCNRGRPR